MTKSMFGWATLTLFALGVAGYAMTITLSTAARPEFVQSLFDQRPIVAPMHFLGGAIALAIGAFQLNTSLRRRFLNLHRWLGRVYVIAIVFGGASGLVMVTTSTGGITSHLGFGLLAIAWLGTTLNAYRHIRQQNFKAHEEWMIRSYAVTLAAVTLRIYLPLSQIADIDFLTAYPVISWLCWVPNLLVAEWIVRSRAAATR
jgi:uncharacterized membrane protein